MKSCSILERTGRNTQKAGQNKNGNRVENSEWTLGETDTDKYCSPVGVDPFIDLPTKTEQTPRRHSRVYMAPSVCVCVCVDNVITAKFRLHDIQSYLHDFLWLGVLLPGYFYGYMTDWYGRSENSDNWNDELKAKHSKGKLWNNKNQNYSLMWYAD